jgi:hypothetical protein
VSRFYAPLVLISAAVLTLGAASCSSHPAPQAHESTSAAAPMSTTLPSPPSPTSSPDDVDAATAALQEKADRHASGDFAGEWLLFTKDMRDHLSQQTFVEYSEACSSPAAGLKITVGGGRLDGPGRAVLRQELLGVSKAATMLYEDGGWYKEPDEFLTSSYGKSSDEMIAADKAAGHCNAS